MGKPKRKSSAPKVEPVGLHSMQVNGLRILDTAELEQVGTRTVTKAVARPDGSFLWEEPDGSQRAYLMEGDEPEGWVKVETPHSEPIYTPTRGHLSSIQIFELDENGDKINLNNEGYDQFEAISKSHLLSMLISSDELAEAHNDFVSAAQAYMRLLYSYSTTD